MKITEQDSHYSHLEQMSPREILEGINNEDHSVPAAVNRAIPSIERLVEEIVKRGGRIFYIGAGTSGRLGVVDASEIPPTYGVSGKFIGIIAGGDKAFRTAVEGAEDNANRASVILWLTTPLPPTPLSASPPPVPPLCDRSNKEGPRAGLLTGLFANEGSELTSLKSHRGYCRPEFVTGSTRMKSGTATNWS